MRKGDFKITGGKQVAEAIKNLEKRLSSRILRQAVKEAAAPVQADAEASAPVLTGMLRDSFTTRIRRRRDTLMATVTTTDEKYQAARGKKLGSDRQQRPLFYAHFYEFGTRRQPARPFMRPVFDRQKDQAASTMMRVLQRELLKARLSQ